jgi:hypothetical protein
MSCPTARVLFEEYSQAATELFEATDKLSALVGQHEAFAAAKKHTDQVYTKCQTSRRALEQHWEEHGCCTQEFTAA